MRDKDIQKIILDMAPLEIQEDWDNSGWQIRLKPEFSRVMTALDIRKDVIEEAVREGCDLIVTHHPLLFDPLRSVDNNYFIGNNVATLISAGISVFSIHTPFDKCIGGINDSFGELLGLSDISIVHGDSGDYTGGYLRKGFLTEPETLQEFIERASGALEMLPSQFRYSGDRDVMISKVCWCCGSGTEFMDLALKEGCELFISGDLKYHTAQAAIEQGLNILDPGHYGTEKHFVRSMADILRKAFPDHGADIIESKTNIDPFAF